MVVRLFVQPGENKLWITPKRPEPLAANATITNSVVASTVLAAGYTSYASGYARRVGIPNTLPVPALFIRASAKAGIWCAAIGAAVNFYHHHEFTKPIGAVLNVPVEWKLWERTEKYTVDDGFLAGAGMGLGIGLVSSLFLKRSPLRWWTRCMGMANMGAFVGIAGSNAYFQYTGERQKAVAVMQQWRRRRSLEFHHIYWDKLLLTRLSVPVQAYVVLNGIFRAASLPEEAVDTPEKYGLVVYLSPPTDSTTASAPESETPTEAQTAPQQVKPYYLPVTDYADSLRAIDVPAMSQELANLEESRTSLKAELNLLAHQLARDRRDLAFNEFPDKDERQLRSAEAHLRLMIFARLMSALEDVNRRLYYTSVYLQHREALDSKKQDVQAWVPEYHARQSVGRVEPKRALAQANQLREQLVGEIRMFEEQVRGNAGSAEVREMTKRNLDEGRMLLRAADRIAWRLEEERASGIEMKGKAKAKAKGVVAEQPVLGKERREGQEVKGTERNGPEEKGSNGNEAKEVPVVTEEVSATGNTAKEAKETKPNTKNVPPKGFEPEH
ncbi:uncharacterized protein EI97DRAFT_454696 [Westerdykella ornata]|uniref:Uncharacterized protein n=1 Tax=Westerdykella ornata TaxID=318751 RepID=A0A6A6JZ55_WESOR|nr:uncharacterized protein EI97DRAFT_454696 [Westerdykella ornata]KAF2281514.1 hypothetical protein EI97DRAFT_454696 [Westerdykella ornata]